MASCCVRWLRCDETILVEILQSKLGAKTGAKAAPAKKKKSPEEIAQEKSAVVIQSRFRCFKEQKSYAELKEKKRLEKEKADKEIEELRQKAWLAEVEYERKQVTHFCLYHRSSFCGPKLLCDAPSPEHRVQILN